MVLDEACQTTEPGCWIPLLRGDRVVLAGDHCQLPPTVVSQEAAQKGFGVSLLERLVSHFGDAIDAAAQRAVSHARGDHGFLLAASFTTGALMADESVTRHRLCDLPGVRTKALTEAPVEFIDTAGASYEEELEPDGESRRNPQEATLVAAQGASVLEAGVAAQDIAVIAPYAAQVRRLREMLPTSRGWRSTASTAFRAARRKRWCCRWCAATAKARSVSLPTSAGLNVALTRARRKLLVVGDSATLSVLPFYQRLFEYFEASGPIIPYGPKKLHSTSTLPFLLYGGSQHS